VNELDDRSGFDTDALGSVIWKGERHFSTFWDHEISIARKVGSGQPPGQSPRCRQTVNMVSNATAWFALTAMRLHKLWCPFGEVQQDLLLSCLTVG
jgi:hypothetical protein